MPHVSAARIGSAFAEIDAGSVHRAWEALRRHLATKNRAINEEVAHYPTPIARCDVQLSKLLEQRARIYCELERIGEIGEPPANDGIEWLRKVERFAMFADRDCDDDGEIALRSRLKDAIAAL